MSEYRFPQEVRGLVRDALPMDVAVSGNTPDLKQTYAPASHAWALRPDSMLVVGIRGSGKSFWWSALQSKEHRQLITSLMPAAGLNADAIVTQGFGEKPSPGDYPGKDAIAKLIESCDARQIWRTIVVWQVLEKQSLLRIQSGSWKEKIDWVANHPEDVEQLLFKADSQLDQKNLHHLILFDALDRTADNWSIMSELVRGLLQVLLDFRPYKRIRPKAFVRPDHLEDVVVANFPDSSKILNQKTELRWPPNELYSLLWQYLANEPRHGQVFRDGCAEEFRIKWHSQEGVWIAPEKLRIDVHLQRTIFHAITGPWMGRDMRRGYPYTWLPNHLGDAYRQVSPRSFMAALRHAADDRLSIPKEHPYALYYESIKRGVQEASRIRVREMQEDYPWVQVLMSPLSGLTVPCKFEEIASKWNSHGTLSRLSREISEANVKLPPVHLDVDSPNGVRLDLEKLGVFERMTDGRVNLPDVYRVGYGMGRRGGIKAVART